MATKTRKAAPATTPEMGVYENFDGCLDAQVSQVVRTVIEPANDGEYVDLAGGQLDADVHHYLVDRALGAVIQATRLGHYLGKPAKPTLVEAKPAQAAKPVAKRGSKVTYSPGRQLTTDDKLAPQALVIVKRLNALGEIGKDELLADLDQHLTTRQGAKRILAWYQKDLVAAGLMEMSK